MTAGVREAVAGLVDRVRAEDASATISSDSARRQSDHASPVSRHPSDRARGRAFRARPRPGPGHQGHTISASKTQQGARRLHVALIARHVGADSAGVILSEAPHREDEMTLIVDVGTNAEIVLGNRRRLRGRLLADGSCIRRRANLRGQRAALGAIERVRIDPDTLEPKYRVVGSDLWSDQPGFSKRQAIGVTGICGSGIIEAVAEMYLAGIVSDDGVIEARLTPVRSASFTEGRTFSYVHKRGRAEDQR